MIRNTELFDAFSDPGYFLPWIWGWGWKNGKIHNYTMANGNLVLMWGGGANLSCDLDYFVFQAITFFCYLG